MSKVTKQQQEEEIQALAAMSEADINIKDIPEVTFTGSRVEVGEFYRPVKKSVTIRLDADVLSWFKDHHSKYQTQVNQILRDYIKTHS